ncbi:hypothetical protein D4R42_00220 [bacterium]|nr:MAG: hypothetical protein D4R42_00220 [bacterium]
MNETETIIITDQKETFEIIKSAVNKSIDLVRPTFGPASHKVIISKLPYFMAVDDGVQIMRDTALENKAENAIVKLVRETAIKTNDRVGDGTTGALIILQAIINEVARKTKFDGRKIELELKKALNEVTQHLKANKKEITTQEELEKVAMISFDDPKIAKMLSELYFKLGKDATITVDKSSAMETTVEMSDGITLNKGYISPYMILNPQRMESVIEKPHILITDYRMTEVNDILPIMNKMSGENIKELIIICDNLEQSAMATAILNKVKGVFVTIAITTPNIRGIDPKVLLEDIALMTGATFFTNSKGNKLEDCEISDLGKAERFICKQTESIIVNPKGDEETIKTSIASLKSAIENENEKKKKKDLQIRLAFFTNKLAVVKVGAPTENEQKALRYKIEDAVHSLKAAINNGISCGAGLALSSIETSSPILNEALKYPARQLRENMGLSDEAENLQSDEAINVVTGNKGNFLEVGVVDPTDVLIAGVESAVSIASMLLTSSGIVVESLREGVKPQQQ